MAQNKALQARKARRRASGSAPQFYYLLSAAVANLAGVFVLPEKITLPNVSNVDALRQDWRRVGADIDAVIERENARVKETA